MSVVNKNIGEVVVMGAAAEVNNKNVNKNGSDCGFEDNFLSACSALQQAVIAVAMDKPPESCYSDNKWHPKKLAQEYYYAHQDLAQDITEALEYIKKHEQYHHPDNNNLSADLCHHLKWLTDFLAKYNTHKGVCCSWYQKMMQK